ncbi:ABC transporter permease [Micromonospora tulbaghiae]|uniref:ABC transport system permease protein n=1 Tax=Micromonospora tulbaghiae TaxID=479978 RepID=A0AAW4JHJ1_9ACTN|nr:MULTISPECIES: FtsX-like permease family protein [Micromonospora]KAB1903524.1 FtsX-like permease family protein [Micromonospora sp. AMSO1212t]MBO4140825.1 ABC transporter permease [Micromonospora tulbaghiae]MDX5461151.1 ABC transporter permease [Micromonospora tulbaghiae]SCF16843.1 putative ABC transport system permease protein [Micromonospora tulbaghiae]
MLRATLKSLLARKLRLLLSGLAVVLGVMFVSGAFVLTDTLGRSFDAVFADAYAEVDVSVEAKPKIDVSTAEGMPLSTPMPASVLDRIKAVPGVADAEGVVAADGARMIGSNGKVVTSFGPPQLGQNWLGESDLVEIREGRAPQADDEIVINTALAEAGKVKVGDRVGVLTLAPKKEFTLVGVFGYSGGRDSIGGANEVYFTTPVAQQLMLGKPDVFSNVSVQAADGTTPEALRDEVARTLGADYQVKTGEQLAADASAGLKEGLSFFNKILLGFAAVALLVGTFLILNTFSIIVAQRTRELALMRAIGASGKQVIGSVVLEALAVGLIASVLGLAAGIGVGALLAYLFGQLAGGLTLAGLGVPASAVIGAFAVGMLITVIAALLPALRASRIPPIAAMQDVATPDRPLTKVTIGGAVVTGIGAVLLFLGLGGHAGDSTLATILGGVLFAFIGVALLTPIISRPVVSLLGAMFSWSVPGKLGRLNSGRNPRRTAITAAALMVGIALVTGVTVILDSAKGSIGKLAEDTIKAELVISGSTTGPRPASFDPAVLEKAAAIPGVQLVSGEYGDMAVVGGERTWVAVSSNVAALQQIFGAKATAGDISRLAPDQMLVSSDTAKARNLAVGSTVPVQLSRGEARTYTVSGIYESSQLTNPVTLPPQAAADFSIPQPIQGFLQLAPGTSVGAVQPQVERLLADSPEVSVADRAAFIEQQTGQLDSLLQMIQILLALAIVIAVLGIINTLALSVLERTRELGLLRAIGLRRAQTMRMITVEAVVISIFGALLGVVVGAGLGAAVVEALKDEGITDLILPWGQMVTFLILAAIIGVVAAVLPAIRAARINVLGAIAHD